MKSVLISIQPKWCELIASGKKTVEVRKTRPKLETPFKAYIYQTKKTWVYNIFSKIADWQGKVIGEFVCNKIYEIGYDYFYPCGYEVSMGEISRKELYEKSCLSFCQIDDYLNMKLGYGWHISNLVIYDKPKELSEFKKINRECWYADLGLAKRDCPECQNKKCFLQRPPQSWCYVEEDAE